MNEHYFDQLTKLAAGGVPRREALRRFGAVVGGALLGSLGLGRSVTVAQTAGNSQGCATFCRKYRGRDLTTCLATCKPCSSSTLMCGGTSINSVTCCTSGNCVNGVCGTAVNLCSGVSCKPYGTGTCQQTGVCNNSTGLCEYPPSNDGTACSDGNACTVNDTCQSGVCVGTPRNCDDGNPCTIDVCDPGAGCLHIPADGQSCGPPLGPCLAQICQGGACGQFPANEGQPCGGPGATCRGGICQGGCDPSPVDVQPCSGGAPDGTACSHPCGLGICIGGLCYSNFYE